MTAIAVLGPAATMTPSILGSVVDTSSVGLIDRRSTTGQVLWQKVGGAGHWYPRPVWPHSWYALTPRTTAVTVDFALSHHLGRSLQTLHRLSDLLPNWDSYGALPLTESALATARRLLGEIASKMGSLAPRDGMPDHIAPLVYGGILLEWEKRGNGDELAVDIGADGEFGYLRVTGAGDDRTFEEQDGVPSVRVHNIVAEFLLGNSRIGTSSALPRYERILGWPTGDGE